MVMVVPLSDPSRRNRGQAGVPEAVREPSTTGETAMRAKPSPERCSALPFLVLALLLSAFVGTAEAAPPIPCDTNALIDAISGARPGATITLTKDCTYTFNYKEASQGRTTTGQQRISQASATCSVNVVAAAFTDLEGELTQSRTD
jgi:hypothetical protein